jgi:hypothetical protein
MPNIGIATIVSNKYIEKLRKKENGENGWWKELYLW